MDSYNPDVLALRAQVSDLEARLRAQISATQSAAQVAEAALGRLLEMEAVVNEAVLVVDRTTTPAPRLLAAVRAYQALVGARS